MYKKAILVGAGDFDKAQFESDYKREIARSGNAVIVIAVDGGYEYIKGICPIDIVLGDFDSLGYVPQDINTQTFPCEKDFTDMQLALKKCEELNVVEVAIYGGLGGRLDHTLANIQNCCHFAKNGMNVVLKGNEDIFFVTKELKINGRVGQVVSVIALEKADGVNYDGFKYSAQNLTINTDFPIGVSNVLIKPQAKINIATGVLAVVLNK